MTSIKRLPEAVHRRLRSGVVINDMARIVEELVCNSVDSGATKIDVAVSIANCCIKVVDNGCGISRDGLMLLGEQHATSKFDDLNMVKSGMENLNFHGEALCSISDVSVLEILTKVQGKPNGYKKIIKHSKCLFLGVTDDRNDVGTTVTVRDIFYNQQVRRKHMESSYYKMLNAVKMTVLRIALVHLNVSFKVIDRDSMNKLLHTQPSTSPSVMLSRNFGVEIPASFFELNVSDGELKLSGFVSAPSYILPVKGIQYAYINSRFIQKGPIHKLLNQLAGKFIFFGSSQLETNNEQLIHYDLSSTFILNVCCPRSYYDVFTDEQSKTIVDFKDWIPVLAFIENSIMHLWNEKASGIRLKSCNTENFQKTLDLQSPRRKKFCRNSDVINMNKSEKVPDIKRPQRMEDLLHENNYATRSRFGSSAPSPLFMGDEIGYSEFSCKSFSPTFASCSHDERGLSAASARSVIKEFRTAEDEKSPFRAYEISACCPKMSDDIDFFGYPSKSLMRSCSNVRSLPHTLKPSRYESFEHGSEGFDVEQWSNCHDPIATETEPMISGKDLWYDGKNSQSSLCNKYNNVEISEAFFLDALKVPLRFYSETSGSKCLAVASTSFSKDGSGYGDEFSFEVPNENLGSSSLTTRDEWQHHTSSGFSNMFSVDKKKIGQSPREIGRSTERFFGSERKSLISTCWESPKKCYIESFFDTAWTLHESTESWGNRYLMSRTKKRSNRSSSAPPFYNGKTRYLDLADSSSMSAKRDSKFGKLQLQQKSLVDEAKLPQLERHCPQAACNVGPVKSDMLASVSFKDGADDLCKWDSSLPIQEAVRTGSGDQKHRDFILDVSSEILCCDTDGIVPNSIDRESLQDARVLSQVDKKFIAVVARNTLALIDQHAADERIRLEELRQKVLSGEMRRLEHLDAEQELVLPEIGYQLLHNYAEQIQAWGWTWNIQDTVCFTENLEFIHKRPAEVKLLSVPSILDVKLTDIDLLEFLQQLADTDGSSTIPPAVLRILNNKACRGAIMFGDALLASECSLIVEELKQTSLCFQCAHGRPTTVPLVELQLLRRSIHKLTSSDDPWHGLLTHEVSLRRTAHRLSQANSSIP